VANAPFFHPEVVAALPTAGSFTARVVQLNAGLVLEREEGAGLFPAEPSRFAFRGGSWTQSRIEIDGFDATDPFFGGRALVWNAVELGDVDVKTDARGTALTYASKARPLSGRARVVAQGNLGLFDSKGTTTDPIPSLARGHGLFEGYLAAFGATRDARTTWSAAVSGVDVTRSERNSDLERPTQKLGFDARLRHVRGDDAYRALAMYQGSRAPFGFTTAETRSRGLLIGGEWRRSTDWATDAGSLGSDRSFARVSYKRGAIEDPALASPRAFERLVDGPPSYQVPYDATVQKAQVDGGRRIAILDTLGLDIAVGVSRATSGRRPIQPSFQALERLNGVSARQWTFTGSAAARLSETLATVRTGLDFKLSERTRLGSVVTAQYLRVGDRDGEKILSSAETLRELTFTWNKSDDTRLTIEGSMGPSTVPLASYESVARGVPLATARLWRDANGDATASASELGADVARRGPGSTLADRELSLPSTRRVMVTFATKVGPLRMLATAYARRDKNLLETALDPTGSEIARTRNIPDPSGDIVGPSDDQILPIVEETSASFTGSRYLLTNATDHRALGEGAELSFAADSRRVHWGLVGSAFRDSGRGGNRGLRVNENDFGVVGETYDRTNTDTFAYGRLFFDRAYSLRMYLTANDVRGFTFGAVGRYDDGQPFARLVIQNDLPQGPDFVQAIPRGRARLHYTLSVDARVARRFKLGEGEVELSASVFNALGSAFEAEEQVVWLPDYRRITMVQPPRAFVIGIRVAR
jgi:hypothetical protein